MAKIIIGNKSKEFIYSHRNKRYPKKALIEYLYLDLKTCDRCIGTDRVLDGVSERGEESCVGAAGSVWE